MATRMCVIILRNGFEFASDGYDTLGFIFLYFARTIGALEYIISRLIFNYIPLIIFNRLQTSESVKPRNGNKASVPAEVSFAEL